MGRIPHRSPAGLALAAPRAGASGVTPRLRPNLARRTAYCDTLRARHALVHRARAADTPWPPASPNSASPTARIGTEGDGEQGLVDGSEVMTATTNAQGQVLTNFTKAADASGDVGVRAELLATVNGQLKIVHEDRAVLQLTVPVAAGGKIYLPLVVR